jgi:hypothetical protein
MTVSFSNPYIGFQDEVFPLLLDRKNLSPDLNPPSRILVRVSPVMREARILGAMRK